MPSSVQVRPAREEDLETILAIDDDASRRYPLGGVIFELSETHPFVVDERARWAAAVRAGRGLLAETHVAAVGMATLGVVDGAPYLDQLSVRMDAMDRGVGSTLIAHALAWAHEPPRVGGLWLTTYGHLPWNRPFYERRGFVLVPEAEWKDEMRAIIASQRACLPLPEQRVVMWHA